MTINELNLQIIQLEAELAHAEVHVSTALEVESRAKAATKKAQNAVEDLQFQLERHARLREQLSENISDTSTETPASASTSASALTDDLTLEAAVRKAVGGKYAQMWTPAILQQLAAPEGLSRFALSVLRSSSGGKFRKLSGTQADRVWEVLRQRCPKVSESLYHGISLGMPKS